MRSRTNGEKVRVTNAFANDMQVIYLSNGMTPIVLVSIPK